MRAETIEEVLIELHAGQWFSWTDSKNKVYENLILAEKIWDVSYTGKKHFEGLIVAFQVQLIFFALQE